MTDVKSQKSAYGNSWHQRVSDTDVG